MDEDLCLHNRTRRLPPKCSTEKESEDRNAVLEQQFEIGSGSNIGHDSKNESGSDIQEVVHVELYEGPIMCRGSHFVHKCHANQSWQVRVCIYEGVE